MLLLFSRLLAQLYRNLSEDRRHYSVPFSDHSILKKSVLLVVVISYTYSESINNTVDVAEESLPFFF